MNIIVAVDNEWGIGRDNKLLFHIPEDMKYFKAMTTNKVVVMGKNTLLSFPNGQPLKNRTNIVLSTTLVRDDVEVIRDIESLVIKLLEFNSDDVFLIGGARIYRELLGLCDKAYVTRVNSIGGASVYFPNLDHLTDWRLESISESIISNGFDIRFMVYNRVFNKCKTSYRGVNEKD
ncbi:MAG: dihydrofolate reductase [Christensenellaceae bacterium]|nr:dihydrofolate reductase [Christensenellaceae bacterium]